MSAPATPSHSGGLRRSAAVGAALLWAIGMSGSAWAQTSGSGPPLPHAIAPDAAGVDLLNGRRVGTDSAISIGLAEAPALEFSEGGGGFGGTPLAGFHYVDGSYPNFTQSFVLGSRIESNRFPDGTARNFPEGMVSQGNVLIEGNGTRWTFASTGMNPPNPTQFLTTLVRPDGERLTYNYSSIPAAGDIRGFLRSITSSAGYQLNIEWAPTSTGTYTLSKATLSNRRYAYCDPLSGACTGSGAWPTISWVVGTSDTTATTSGLRSVVYGARQRGVQVGGTSTDPIWEWTQQVTSGAGVTRTYVGRYRATSAWPPPPYYGRQYYDPAGEWRTGVCIDTSVIWRVQAPAGTWTYNYTNTCQWGLGTSTRTDPLGNQSTRNGTSFTDELGDTTTYAFIDQWGNAVGATGAIRQTAGQTLPEGNQVSWNYGGAYSPQNLLGVTVTPEPGSTEPTLSWSSAYPTGCTVATTIYCHQPSSETDPRGNRVDYTYDPVHGGVLTRTLPADASGVRPQIRYTYQQLSARVLNASGVLVNETPIWKLVSTSECRTTASCAGTADEIVTSYTYDDNLLPVTETVRAGDGSVSRTITRTYDPVGNLVSVDGPDAGPADTTRYVYDALRRRTATLSPDPDGAGALPVLVTRTTYNGDNQPTAVAHGTATNQSDAALAAMTVIRRHVTDYDSAGRRTRESTISTAGNTIYVTQYSYDAANRLQCTAVRMNSAIFATLPASACTPGTEGSYGPDRITKNVYDAAGQRVQLREGIVAADLDGVAEATWAYNPNGQVTTLIDGNGNRATMAYDGHGRQTRWTFPSDRRPTAYNDTSQATALSSAGNADSTDYESYTYDGNGNRTSHRRRNGATLTFIYDALNRVTRKTVPEWTTGTTGAPALDPIHTRNVYYAYDLRGLMTRARFDGLTGDGVSNWYDALGRTTQTSLKMNGVTRMLTYQHDLAGNRTRITHPDGTYFVTEYDQIERPTEILANGTTSLAAIAYQSNGLPSGVTRGNAASTALSYDGLQRLSGLTHGFTGTVDDVSWTYAYNAAGQIRQTTRNNDAYGYVQANFARTYTINGLNQMTAANSTPYGYDASGNFASSSTLTHVYDLENRLVETSGTRNVSMTYDPLGRLFSVESGTTTTEFLYDGNALVAEYAGGVMTRRYVHNVGADVPFVSYAGAALTQPSHLHADHQGSIVAVSDTVANAAVNSYDEYGVAATTNVGRFQYTGQIMVPELGWYYYKARFYSAGLGRFMQVDPVGYDGGINLYGYVRNDPINLVDVSGAAPGEPFRTWRDAGVDFLNTYNFASIASNNEYYGLVYEYGGYFYSTPATIVDADGGVRRRMTVPENGLRVNLHSHGAYSRYDGNGNVIRGSKFEDENHGFRSDEISDHDVDLGRNSGRPVMVGTPGGDYKLYHPETGEVEAIAPYQPTPVAEAPRRQGDPNLPDCRWTPSTSDRGSCRNQ